MCRGSSWPLTRTSPPIFPAISPLLIRRAQGGNRRDECAHRSLPSRREHSGTSTCRIRCRPSQLSTESAETRLRERGATPSGIFPVTSLPMLSLLSPVRLCPSLSRCLPQRTCDSVENFCAVLEGEGELPELYGHLDRDVLEGSELGPKRLTRESARENVGTSRSRDHGRGGLSLREPGNRHDLIERLLLLGKGLLLSEVFPAGSQKTVAGESVDLNTSERVEGKGEGSPCVPLQKDDHEDHDNDDDRTDDETSPRGGGRVRSCAATREPRATGGERGGGQALNPCHIPCAHEGPALAGQGTWILQGSNSRWGTRRPPVESGNKTWRGTWPRDRQTRQGRCSPRSAARLKRKGISGAKSGTAQRGSRG